MTRTGVSGLIVAAVAVLCLGSWAVLISARECTSIDVRNNVASLNQLEGCTVIKGFLMIVLLTKGISVNDYSNITFPDLREITDFFILYDVKGLTSFKNLLPNLTVIRGRRLFLNYALVVSNMPDLAAFEFKSLVAIQRGHVFIGSCPKLCFLKKVNWDRLTLSPGENHIIPMADVNCAFSGCGSCPSEYCWSNMVCQKFENDNVVNLARGSEHCHPECLGGCYNSTNAGCVVCKGITNHGLCVDSCPLNLYFSEHHQRCYTKSECGQVRYYVYANECNRRCPSGYRISRKLNSCIRCVDSCESICYPPEEYGAFVIYNLADADLLSGCKFLNGSLYIEFRNNIDEKDLIPAFWNIHEVQGYIKIVRSPNLRSLKFLQNLEKVHGVPLENKTFALVIYKNDNLEELWTPAAGKTVEFVNGGIYTYSNYQLCNRVVQEFVQRIVHDKDKDVLQINDQEVLCDPSKLNLEVNPISQFKATISWPQYQTADKVEIIYREAKYSKGEKSEMEDHVCERENWKRDLLFKKDIPHNDTHSLYLISGLKPYTRYEVLVKTFERKDDYSARSPIKEFMTTADYPTAPKLATFGKTFKTITLHWTPRNETEEIVNYYLLEIYEQTIDRENLDLRNFCERPIMVFGGTPLEDYNDCCARMQQDRDDEQFKTDMEVMFPCSVVSRDNCHNMNSYGIRVNTTRIEGKFYNFTFYDLKPSTTYTFFIYACNGIGCGTYYMYSDKTNFSPDADMVDKIEACRVPETNEYRLHFKEPKLINGAIVSYSIHFEGTSPTNPSEKVKAQVSCVTRKQHELAHFQYVTILNETYNKTAIRTNSLAGSNLSKFFNIDICKEYEPEQGIGAIGVFVICCTICAVVALIWVSIRRRWWRNLNFSGWGRQAQRVAGAVGLEDRQGLMVTYDVVTFRNTPEEL